MKHDNLNTCTSPIVRPETVKNSFVFPSDHNVCIIVILQDYWVTKFVKIISAK